MLGSLSIAQGTSEIELVEMCLLGQVTIDPALELVQMFKTWAIPGRVLVLMRHTVIGARHSKDTAFQRRGGPSLLEFPRPESDRANSVPHHIPGNYMVKVLHFFAWEIMVCKSAAETELLHRRYRHSR